MGRIIFHIDVNSAFLSWEAVYRIRELNETLDLRTIPSAVGGDVKKRLGVILAKSFPAKKFDIRTGEAITEALKKCPELMVVPPHHDLYRSYSQAFLNILREYSPCVEPCSIDEAYCDMSGTELLYKSPVAVAYEIKKRIFEELGFTVNVGISTNKLLAKMASDLKKPDMVHTLFPEEIKEKMWKLPVSELFYVGRASAKKLHTLGINTIGELANTDTVILKAHFKKYGELIHDFANGIDSELVTDEQHRNKGYGNSATTAFDVDNEFTAKMFLLSMAENVSARLRADSVLACVVAVQLVDFEFHMSSHQMTLSSPSNMTNDIYRAACELFDQLWDNVPIRKLGIHAGGVVEDLGIRQLNLFDSAGSYEKQENLDRAIDKIRNRYGKEAIIRASCMERPFSPERGNISAKDRKEYEKKQAGVL